MGIFHSYVNVYQMRVSHLTKKNWISNNRKGEPRRTRMYTNRRWGAMHTCGTSLPQRRWSLLRFGRNNKKRLGCQSTNNANNVYIYILYIYTYTNRTFGVQPKWLSKGVSKCAPITLCFVMFRDGMTYIAFYSRRFATATARTASLGSRS